MSEQALNMQKYCIRGDIDSQPAQKRPNLGPLFMGEGCGFEWDMTGILPNGNDCELGPHDHLSITNKPNWNLEVRLMNLQNYPMAENHQGIPMVYCECEKRGVIGRLRP
jgi:hypothetical protein